MPSDKFGHPFFYPSKPGGWFWQQPDSPKNDSGADFSAEFSFPSAGIIKMSPNGPTDFGLGKNISSFSDSIGGCNMDFAATAKRGYAYKPDDARDVEIKAIVKISNLGGHGFSISTCTGHHSSSGCCQGFAYMATTEVGATPTYFTFRKEMWHVSYHNSPTGDHDIAGSGKTEDNGRFVGIGFCRYNKPVAGKTSPQDDHVVLEYWWNPDPDADKTNWKMIFKEEDFVGHGWGNDGDKCNGAKDQSGPWSNAQNRFKTNATSGSILFKEVTLREIDPFGSFDSGGGGGGGGGGAVSRDITYALVGTSGQQTDPNNYYLNSIVVAHEIVEALGDPDPRQILGPNSWRDTTINGELCDGCGGIKDHQYGTGADSYWLPSYWSNSDNNCVVPRVDLVDLGSSTKMQNIHSGPVLANAKIFMIFWGSDWQTRVAPPTGAGFIDRIKNRLLGTDKEFFARLTQYDNIAAPTWGGSAYNTSFAIPTNTSITEAQGTAAIVDTFNRGLLPIPTSPNEDLYILMLPIGKTLTSTQLSTLNGLHSKMRASLTIPPPIIDPPPSGGCPAGTHLENGVCVSDTITPPPTPTTSRVYGFLSLLWDINTVSGSGACTGTGGEGGGPSGDLAVIYDVSADSAKELSNTSTYDYRTRLVEKINTSDSVLKGEVVKQLDVPLKKFGDPNITHTIYARIWSSGGGVMYTSPTTFLPTVLTTSFVTKTFDFSTNTHALQLGDKIGVEYVTSTSSHYVIGGFGDNNTNRSIMSQYEGTTWDDHSDRDFACKMWS